jgi:hypothetical protein
VVAPGLIDTPLGRRATAGRPGRARTPVPLGRTIHCSYRETGSTVARRG